MRIKYNKYNIHILSLLCAITACSSEESVNTADPKSPVELSVGVEGPMSRASVITDEVDDKTFSAFGSETDIWMVMQSEYKSLSATATPDEKDYKGSQATKYCVTYGTTGTAKDGVNPVNITEGNIRFWDDAHARSSALSIWALAVPGKTGTSAVSTWNTTAGWGSSNPTKTIDWTIATAQDGTTIVDNDLCFSNNIVDYSASSNGDRRMKYQKATSQFDEGKLVFYHALSKITIKMIAGDGFKHDGTDFQFDGTADATAAPVALNGFSTSGTFNVENGVFNSPIGSAASITTMYKAATTPASNNPYYTLEALVMPGTNLSTAGVNNAVSFSIDGNAFTVSSEILLAKLKENNAVAADWTTIEAGKNYIFTFRVSKTSVKVAATVKDWEVIEAAKDEPIIHVDTAYGLEAGTNGLTAFTENFSFLKSLSHDTGYKDDADAEYASTKYTLKPAQYWPNHNTHYFFRGVWPLIDNVDNGKKTPTAKVSVNSIAVQNAKYDSDKPYPSNLMLGYPRTTSEKCTAHNYVVANQGICATEGEIRMNFQRVMSQIEVNLKSSDPSASDYVTFDSDTKVEIIDGYVEGYIMLGNGESDFTSKNKIPANSVDDGYVMNRADDTHKKYLDVVVPQSLEESSSGLADNIKFRITVKSTDGWLDKYETVLGIKSIPVTINGVSTDITKWEPGKKYVYTLTITKTGIKVVATIKDWINATGSTTITM